MDMELSSSSLVLLNRIGGLRNKIDRKTVVHNDLLTCRTS